MRLRATITQLKKTIANKNKELAQIREDVPALVRAVHQLTLENQELRAQLERPEPNVTPLRQRGEGVRNDRRQVSMGHDSARDGPK
ncbi:hypothetical protein GCM10022419_106490 [Nonomuraea rosea]|uniref:Uncharacterized protein n=1 Tax=Nonomuraea rosea TaxID=638574 RepID=A0ABP6ZCP6_9ACTN